MKIAPAALFHSFETVPPPLADRPRRIAPVGQVYAKSADTAGLDCFRYTPVRRDLTRPPLFCIHGISRNALEHVYAFRQQADEMGFPIIAPIFDPASYRGYQTLGAKTGWNALAAFDALLDEVSADFNASAVNLFGFSGGGQFAHRYAMARPARISALAISSAGWYTFPSENVRYPRGFAENTQLLMSLGEYLRIPMLAMVGSADTERDATLRQGKKINAQQGADRVARAKNWTGAVNAAAGERGLPPPAAFAELAGAAHSFVECVAAGLVLRAMEFFRPHVLHENKTPSGDQT